MSTQILKKLSFGTLLMQTVLSIVLVLGIHGMVMAADPPAPGAATPSATSSFNVTSYLTTKGQGQEYFKKGSNPIGSFIIEIINFLVLTIGSLCFVAIVIGGFVLMTSHGDTNQLEKGKSIITLAIVGLVIVLTSYFIASFVQSLFYETPPA